MLRFFVSLSSANKKDSLAVLLLLAVGICLFWPLLLGNQVLFFGDISLYFTPLLHFQQGEVVGQGRIPLWNPQILCGTPFIGNPQAWPLYPTSLLLYWLPAEEVTGITGAIQVFWASVGTYAFLQRQGRSRAASLLAGVAWGFGGVLVSKMQFPNMAQSASWLPWLLLACEGVLRRATAGRGLLLGLVVGLSLLAAHPQMFLLQFYLAAAWSLWRLAGLKEDRRRWLAFLVMGLILGIGLAAAQLLPTLELVQHSVRPALPLEKANRFILPAYAVLTNFLAPNFYGNPAFPDNPSVGRGNFWEPCCYLGVVPFLLFIYGAIVRFRESETRLWLLVALLGVWLAVGREAGLFRVAFAVLPGINRFHDAARFLIPATFGIVCAAAPGLDYLLVKLKPNLRRLVAAILLLLTAIDVLNFSRTLNPTMAAREFREATGSAKRADLSSGRLFQADEGKIWGAFVSYRTYEALSTSEERRVFLQSLAPNLSVLAGWRDAAGYEPVRLATIDAVLAPLKDASRKEDKGNLESLSAVLDALAVEHIAHWDRVSGKVHIVPRLRQSRAARAQLWSNGHIMDRSVEASGVSVPLKILESAPDRVKIRLPLPHHAGLVVLADADYPGWVVTLDGEPAKTLTVNGAFRGVFVGRGNSEVCWKFDPGTWRVGLFISLLAVGIMSVIASTTMIDGGRRKL